MHPLGKLLCILYLADVVHLQNTVPIGPLKGYRWSNWSPVPQTCSTTCGRGVRCRVRKCLDPYGKIVHENRRCQNPQDHASRAESCTICVQNAECPRMPDWGPWGAWTECLADEKGNREVGERCTRGLRFRYRACRNEGPNNSTYCLGPRQQRMECRMNCDDRPLFHPENINQQISMRVEKDYKTGLHPFQQVLRRREGDHVRLSCNTPAYQFATHLSVEGNYLGRSRNMQTKNVRVTWYKNGNRIANEKQRKRYWMIRNKAKKATSKDPLVHEQLRWEALLHSSIPQFQETDIIFHNLLKGDQGFYTCELSFDEERWITVFYSIIITGVRYKTKGTDPFYLHSNVGARNALENSPVWMEAAHIVWRLNGIEQSRGLAARPSRRIQLIEHLNQSHNGMWTCYLVVSAFGLPSVTSSPRIRVGGIYLLNEFHLRVEPESNHLWQIAETPDSQRVLRNIVVALAVIGEFFLLMLVLTIWAAKRWITRTYTLAQRKAVMEQLTDNNLRLILTARKRAAANRLRLLPLIINDQKRLDRSLEKLTDRYVDYNEIFSEGGLRLKGSRWFRSSSLSTDRQHRISRLFKKLGSGLSIFHKSSKESSESEITFSERDKSVLSRRRSRLTGTRSRSQGTDEETTDSDVYGRYRRPTSKQSN